MVKKTFHALGLMSGSSLDGLDLALCRFETAKQESDFQLEHWELCLAETLPFSEEWQEHLRKLPSASAFQLAAAHVAFGHYLGELVQQFLTQNQLEPAAVDLIASHGHTIFHEPACGFTLQIGDGAALAARTGCAVVCDFRSADLALGGQGAPLAPVADKMLFPGYDFYLNIGGIANITCNANGRFVAFDVTGANQVLNALANLLGQACDQSGKLAAAGKVDGQLLTTLNSRPYLDAPYPKSLSNQWVVENMVKTCLQADSPIPDRLHTACRHIAFQLGRSTKQVIKNEHFEKEKYRMLATGGGVFNDFLIQSIREENQGVEIVIPPEKTVNFKEACLMALLGVLRLEGVPNCISSVTGAEHDAIGGAFYLNAFKKFYPN